MAAELVLTHLFVGEITILNGLIQYDTMQYDTIRYDTIQHGMIK